MPSSGPRSQWALGSKVECHEVLTGLALDPIGRFVFAHRERCRGAGLGKVRSVSLEIALEAL